MKPAPAPTAPDHKTRGALRLARDRLPPEVIDIGGLLYSAKPDNILSVWGIPALNATLTDGGGGEATTNQQERTQKARQALFDIAVYLRNTPSKTPVSGRIGAVNQRLPGDLQVSPEGIREIVDLAARYLAFCREEELRLSHETGTNGHPETGGAPDPEITPEHRDEAIRLLSEGKALQHIRTTFKTLHSGDEGVIDAFVIAYCVGSSINAQGVQPALNGPKGGGKTSAARGCTHLLPRGYLVAGTFSNKALFYSGLKPGMVLFSDDTVLNDEINDLLKRAMSNFQGYEPYHTLDKDRNLVTLHLPPRCVYLFTAISDQGDDQFSDRQFKVSIGVDPQRDEEYITFLKRRMREGGPDYPLSRDVLICRAIFLQIRKNLYNVVIPFSDRIEYSHKTNRRLLRFHADFITGHAILHHMNRERGEPDDDGVIPLIATEEDLTGAKPLFKANEESRQYSLTRDEAALWQFFRENGEREVTLQDLFEKYGGRYKQTTGRDLSYTTFRRFLYGRGDRGPDGGGLLGKIPGAGEFKELVTRERGGNTTRRYETVIRLPLTDGGLSSYGDFYTLREAPAPEHEEGETPEAVQA